MSHTTLIHYQDADGKQHIKKTPRFNAQTRLGDIVAWILMWLWGDFAFLLKIDDGANDMAIFDEDYLNDYDPYNTQSTSSEIKLHVIQTSGKNC